MKKLHGLLLLVILALLGVLGVLRPIEGFADERKDVSRLSPKNQGSGQIEIPSQPSSTYTPDYKGMALSSLSSMKDACNSLASIETYLKQDLPLPTQIAPTQISTPPSILRPMQKETPAVEQGKIIQSTKPAMPTKPR